jgi:23S rRNA pseudouridine2605 synthase
VVRLQKFLADAGVASRRAAEEIILAGRVAVNGEKITTLGTRVDPLHDSVAVDGKPLRTRRKQYIALHKPKGLVCTRSDELGRPTVYELLPKEWAHLHLVGRLDYNSEGLIFLTNDGDFSLRLTHPRYGVRKKYHVTVEGPVAPGMLQKFTHGIVYLGDRLKAERARVLESSQTRSLVELELAEGKNREVRRLFESQGVSVKRLQRIQIGKIKLGELPSAKWRTLTEAEIKSLLS